MATSLSTCLHGPALYCPFGHPATHLHSVGANNRAAVGTAFPLSSSRDRRIWRRAPLLSTQAAAGAEINNVEGGNDSTGGQTAAQFVLEKAGISSTASSSGSSCCGGGCGGDKGDAKSVAQQLAEMELSYVTGQMEGNVTRADVQAAYTSGGGSPQASGGPSEEKFLDIAAILQEASSESGNFIFEDDLDEFMV